jgi:hypothetical protein
MVEYNIKMKVKSVKIKRALNGVQWPADMEATKEICFHKWQYISWLADSLLDKLLKKKPAPWSIVG